MQSAWGVEHTEISKAKKPKYRATLINTGHEIDQINVRSNGKTLFRRRPKYDVTGFSSKAENGSYAHVTRAKLGGPTHDEIQRHLRSGKNKSRINGMTYVGKALFPGQTLGAAQRAGSLVAKPAVNRISTKTKMAGLPKPPSSQPRSPRSAQKISTGSTMVKPVTPVKPISGPTPGGTSSFQVKRTMTPGAKLVAGGTAGGAAIGGGSLMNRRNK